MATYGKLYMIPCPISDCPVEAVLPPRNRDIVERLGYFIVENIRSARRFLGRGGLGLPVGELKFAECNEHTSPEEFQALVAPLLEGHDVGFISEAGVPGVADPGAEVAAICHRAGIRVIPLVGPSSILLALMASGQNGQSFAFNGYIPVKQPQRNTVLKSLEKRAAGGQSQLFIETPYRNAGIMDDMLAVLSQDTRVTVAADITGEGEFIRTLTIREWRAQSRPDINKRPAIFIIGR